VAARSESPYRRWLAAGLSSGAEPIGDERRSTAARVARKLGAFYRAHGRRDEARALYERALGLVEGTPQEAEVARLLAEL
jgi:hypothetical protein